MNTQKLRTQLLSISQKYTTRTDVSHDIHHVLRVLKIAEQIAKKYNADLEIIIPAALFHDIIVYPKHSPKSKHETEESAAFAKKWLTKIKGYPKEKIEIVMEAICQCSFSKGIKPKLIEAKILQDADRLDATGALSIMRTFSSAGQWQKQFFDPVDPFAENRAVDNKSYALDLFFTRLLVVGNMMHTPYAKKLAKRRTKFLKDFLKELKLELLEINKS